MPESPADKAAFAASETRLPLNGITVLDLTLARAGPTAVRHFADWGANVIRIEPPATEGEDVAGRRHGFDFQNLHRNKRAVTLNLKSTQGHEAFMRLAKTADVILENMRANVKHRLKVSYDDVKAINPRIVYGSISGFGQDGPYGPRAGVDQIAQGMGGLMSITGEPGRGPMRVGIPVDDLTAGNLLALGCMMALFDRERTGVGRWVTTSLLEAQVFMLDFQASRWLMEGEVAGQAGNDHPTGIPTGVSPPVTATSTSPPARRASSPASARRSSGRTGWKKMSGRPRSAARTTARRSTPRSVKSPGRNRQTTGSSCSRPTASVRPDLFDRPGVRRSAVGGLFAHGMLHGLPSMQPAIGQTAMGAVILAPIAGIALAVQPPTHAPSSWAIASALALALGGTSVAYLCYYWLIARVGPSRTLIVTYLLPCMALVYGALLLKEAGRFERHWWSGSGANRYFCNRQENGAENNTFDNSRND